MMTKSKDMPMRAYTVASPIMHDGERYEPGEKIQLSEDQAHALQDALATASKAADSAKD